MMKPLHIQLGKMARHLGLQCKGRQSYCQMHYRKSLLKKGQFMPQTALHWQARYHMSSVADTKQSEQDRTKLPNHVPVMVDTAIDMLNPQENQVYVDMTFGGGGHTQALLQRAPGARVVCLDRDPVAYGYAQTLADQYSHHQILPVNGKFSELSDVLMATDIHPNSVDGFIFDVGASSMQFESGKRGFSIIKDGPLDMRMDGNRVKNQLTAMDVVNNLDETDLASIIKAYGEDRIARRIANAIVESRYVYGKITTTKQLADIVTNAFNGKTVMKDKMNRKAHVATRTFQALRIFVNDELNELHNGLDTAYHYLKPGGRCVVISFHSLEDRIIKRHFHHISMDERKSMSAREQIRLKRSSVAYDRETVEEAMTRKWEPINKHLIQPSAEELEQNPKCRSAKLRAAIKL